MVATTAAVRSAARVGWRFGRPHTLAGTTVSVASLLVLAAYGRPGAALAVAPGEAVSLFAVTWLAAAAANVFIVGLNQIHDVAIDKVNKPWLPLAAGDLSPLAARRAVAGAGLVSLAAGAAGGRWLLATVAAGMAVGVAYSAPRLRLKSSAWAAAGSIALVRGPVVNLGLAAHFAASLGTLPPRQVWQLTAFATAYGLGIAVAKDLPDRRGDRRFGVRTIAVSHGPRAASLLSLALLVGALALAALLGRGLPHGYALAIADAAAAGALIWHAQRTRGSPPRRMRAHYRLIWGLFCLQYAAVALAAVL